jgi:hypothetical protein
VPTDTVAGFAEGLTAVNHAAADLPLATLTLVTLGNLAMTYRKISTHVANRDVHLFQIISVCSTFQPTECIYVFCVDLRTNSDYLPIQH